MKQNTMITTLIVLLACASLLWAGFQTDTDEILYQRLDGIDMPEDSIAMVMALPRTLITNWDGPISCATYLEVAPAVAAAAIVYVNNDNCIQRRVLFNYNRLRKGKK